MKTAFLLACVAGLLLASCTKGDNKVTLADKTALQDSVNAAQALYDGTVEGPKPGQYETGSKAAFKTILDNAQAVLADANASQTAVLNTTARLAAAMNTYKSHVIEEVAAANLVGYWKMNGNPNDSSGKGNNGVLKAGAAYYGSGTPTLTADRFGRANMAYHFDQGGNIQVTYKPVLNPQEMTISVWVKKEAPATRTINTNTYTILSLRRWYGYTFQLQEANKFLYSVRTVNGTDTLTHNKDDNAAVLDNDTWYHGVVTFKAGAMNFYVNGDLVQSWTDTPGNAVTLSDKIDFVIGQDLPTDKYSTVDGDPYFVNVGGFWTGDLDDVMFYNIALDATQVQSIYNNQKDL